MQGSVLLRGQKQARAQQGHATTDTAGTRSRLQEKNLSLV